ncbi:MAG: WD40 repeat domain-containing protein [Zavarzinella sp.]
MNRHFCFILLVTATFTVQSEELPKMEKAHRGWVNAVAVSPNYIATAGDDDQVFLWHIPGLKLAGQLKLGGKGATALAFHPTEQILAVGGWNGKIILWDYQAKKTINVGGHRENITALQWANGGQHLISGSGDDAIRIWNRKTQKCENILTHENEYDIAGLNIPHDSELLISVDGDAEIRVWSTKTWKELESLSGHEGAITEIASSRSGKMFATASRDKTIILWDTASRKKIRQLFEHQADVTHLTWGKDDNTLISVDEENNLLFWNLTKGKTVKTIRKNQNITSLQYSYKLDILILGGKQGSIFEKLPVN